MDNNIKEKQREILDRFRKFYHTHREWTCRKIAAKIDNLSRGAVHSYILGRSIPTEANLLKLEEFLKKYDKENN